MRGPPSEPASQRLLSLPRCPCRPQLFSEAEADACAAPRAVLELLSSKSRQKFEFENPEASRLRIILGFQAFNQKAKNMQQASEMQSCVFQTTKRLQ